MKPEATFTHVLNPFPAKSGSEHAVASAITWDSLRTAVDHARSAGVQVYCRAVVLAGDESAVEAPASSIAQLGRSVADVAHLTPRRTLPLVGDILKVGAKDVQTSHLIFTNMDISVVPTFYTRLRAMIAQPDMGFDVPFTVGRINIDARLADGPIERMYAAPGEPGKGYDCFIIPISMVEQLDLGHSCIGAAHFDQLLFMALDAVSGHRVRHLNNSGLTFHLGNNIAWSAMLDYVEHNLAEALSAIERMKNRYQIKPGSVFDKFERGHFRRNATRTSALLRKVRRLPLMSSAVLLVKRAIGRQY